MKTLLVIVFLGGSALAQMTPAGGSWVRFERIDKIDEMTRVTYTVLAAPSNGRGGSEFSSFVQAESFEASCIRLM